jgi:hypothetical protein
MRARYLLAVCCTPVLALLLGCPSKEKVGSNAMTVLGPGVVNDPKNKSLRFDILQFGLERFCQEMTRRSVPLKLADDQPVLGRYFADTCSSQILDDENRKSFVVQYAGKGYAWTNLTKRVGFKAAGLVEYAPDFQLHEGAMYVYFRARRIDATSFETRMVESAAAQTGIAVTGTDANQVGQNIVKGQLQRGFTVIRYDSDGATDFGLGYIAKGALPFKPYRVENSDKIVLANDRTEIHSEQQDYIGAFEVLDEGQALYFTLTLDGAPEVDAFVVPKGNGDLMIESYLANPGPTRLTAPPVLDEPIRSGTAWKRFLPLPKGLYYLVIDHSSQVGHVAPPAQVGDDRAAKLDYLVQLGETP